MSRERRYTVYFCHDADDVLLYVGVSGQVKHRLYNHEQTTPWWPEVARVEQEHYPTTEEACAREHEIMHSLAPRHNKDLTLQVLRQRPPDAALTLRLPDELHARLVELAAREHRTVTAQIVHLLEEGERETRRRLAEREEGE